MSEEYYNSWYGIVCSIDNTIYIKPDYSIANPPCWGAVDTVLPLNAYKDPQIPMYVGQSVVMKAYHPHNSACTTYHVFDASHDKQLTEKFKSSRKGKI